MKVRGAHRNVKKTEGSSATDKTTSAKYLHSGPVDVASSRGSGSSANNFVSEACSPSNQAKFDALTLVWIHLSLRPFSIIEDSGLRNLISFASTVHGEPALCSNQNTLVQWSTKLYENCNFRMQQLIQNQTANHNYYFSMTADSAVSYHDNTSGGLDPLSLYAFAIHFVTTEFDMKTLFLHSGTCNSSGEDVSSSEGQSVFDKWGLEELKLTMLLHAGHGLNLFNNACKNDPIATTFEKCDHVPVIGQSLHLICGPFCSPFNDDVLIGRGNVDDIADFSFDAIASDITLYEHVQVIRRVVAKIRNIARTLGTQGTTPSLINSGSAGTGKRVEVVADEPNRWSSTHTMLAQAVQQQTVIEDVITDMNVLPTAEDWAVAFGFWILLTPFQSLVDSLNCETDPSMIYAYPFLCRVKNILNLSDLFRKTENNEETRINCGSFIKESLERFLEEHGDQDYYESVVITLEASRATLREQFDYRFSSLNEFFLWASMLDPRLRKLNHCTEEEERSRAKQSLLSEMVELANEAGVAEPGEDKMTSSASALNDMFGDVFDDPGAGVVVKLAEGTTEENTSFSSPPVFEQQQQAAEYELTQYLAAPSVHKNITALSWWKTNHSSYPMLARVARKWLSVMAVPTPPDRIVSNNGFVHRARTLWASQHGVVAGSNEEIQWNLKLKMKSLDLTTEEIADILGMPTTTTHLRSETSSQPYVPV